LNPISIVGAERSSRSVPMGGLLSGSTARTGFTSGIDASRWIRMTISISMRGASSEGSPMYHDR
jgi:hypothetical protein